MARERWSSCISARGRSEINGSNDCAGCPASDGVPGLPGGLARSYEDLVLGKIYADATVERAGDAVRRYQGRDRGRGVAFVVNQFRERAGFGGVLLSPAVLKSLLEAPADE